MAAVINQTNLDNYIPSADTKRSDGTILDHIRIIAIGYYGNHTQADKFTDWLKTQNIDINEFGFISSQSDRTQLVNNWIQQYSGNAVIDNMGLVKSVLSHIIIKRLHYKSLSECKTNEPENYEWIKDFVLNEYLWNDENGRGRLIKTYESLDIAKVGNAIISYHSDDAWLDSRLKMGKKTTVKSDQPTAQKLTTIPQELEAIKHLLIANPMQSYTDTDVSKLLGITRKKAALRLHYLATPNNKNNKYPDIYVVSESIKKYQYIPERRKRNNMKLHGLHPVCDAIAKILEPDELPSKRQLREQVRELLGSIANTTIDDAIEIMTVSGCIKCIKINGSKNAYRLTENNVNQKKFDRLLTTDERFVKYAPKC